MFGPLTDEELIADLSTRKSLREYAKIGFDYLGPEYALKDTANNNPSAPILYYLQAQRPALLARLEAEGKDMAQNWPGNYRHIMATTRKGGWWAKALVKHFRAALRARMHGLPVTAWVETIWTVVPEIIETTGVKRVPSMAEALLYQYLHLPSAIHYGFTDLPRHPGTRGPQPKRPNSPNLAPEIRKALRRRLKTYFEQT